MELEKTASSGSVYLYDKKHRHQLIDAFSSGRCSESIKIMVLLDREDQSGLERLQLHTRECPSCFAAYQSVRRNLEDVNAALPWIRPSSKLQERFSSRIDSHFRGPSFASRVWDILNSDLTVAFKWFWVGTRELLPWAIGGSLLAIALTQFILN
jgi:hypothetical protein